MILAEYIFGDKRFMVMMHTMIVIQMHIMAGLCYRM